MKIGEGWSKPLSPNFNQIKSASKDDILREIKTTNEILKIMIDKMDEILVYLKGKPTTS